MKKILTLAIIAIATTVSVQAQRNGAKAPKKCATKPHNIGAKLNLSADQKTQIKTINTNFKSQAQAVKNNDALTQGEAKKQLNTLQEQRKASMQNILTPEQKNKLEQEKEHAKNERQEKQKDRLEKMKNKLNLSEDQVAKFKAQQQATQQKVEEIKNNTSLTKQEQKEQIKALMQNRKDQVKELLTPEQLEQLKKRKG
jgi:Spy/CpxP family protein refolding chaperone